MPTTELTEDKLTDGAIDIISMMVEAGMVATRSEGRRAIEQGGVTVDGEKVTDIGTKYTKEDLSGEGKIVKKGKKSFNRIVMK